MDLCEVKERSCNFTTFIRTERRRIGERLEEQRTKQEIVTALHIVCVSQTTETFIRLAS